MSISSGIGIDVEGRNNDYLFNEEMGLVIEIENSDVSGVIERLYSYNIKYDILGHTNRSRHIIINYNNKLACWLALLATTTISVVQYSLVV